MNTVKVILLATLIFLFVFVVFMTVPLYFLWNWLMPTIFGLSKITMWQAAGLTLLTSILFKNVDFKETK